MSIISPIEPDRRGCCRWWLPSVAIVDGPAANTVMIMRGFVTINFLETCRRGMALAWTWTLHNGQQLASS